MATIVRKGRGNFEINASGNISTMPYFSITTGGSPRTLEAGNKHGTLKKILNESGSDMVLNSDILVQGAATDTITISNNGWVELMYIFDEDLTERYRVVDKSSGAGVSLS